MAKQEGATMPSSQGGLVQYFDGDSGMGLDPKFVIGACTATTVVMLALHSGILS